MDVLKEYSEVRILSVRFPKDKRLIGKTAAVLVLVKMLKVFYKGLPLNFQKKRNCIFSWLMKSLQQVTHLQ